MSEQLTKQMLPRELPAELIVERLQWKRRNYGVLAKIARGSGYTKAYVTAIFKGEKSNKDVERRLAEAGAPGFESSSTEAA